MLPKASFDAYLGLRIKVAEQVCVVAMGTFRCDRCCESEMEMFPLANILVVLAVLFSPAFKRMRKLDNNTASAFFTVFNKSNV